MNQTSILQTSLLGSDEVGIPVFASGLLSRVTVNPQVMGGKPCIRGMRINVGVILGLLSVGRTAEQILDDYPELEAEDILAALSYASYRVEEIDVPLAG
ncbi:MAG: DUF433 domain-containing protein [Planctomycetaceae bacterium]|jgi:uncharacterized protein (DUF433 family)|nr:DUF433 domain-containing protein [Planctomycetaceae bacterium]